MIRTFCDGCGEEMDAKNTPLQGQTGSRLATKIIGRGGLGVEVITSQEGVSNKGEWCKYCILDALYSLDDRPRLKK